MQMMYATRGVFSALAATLNGVRHGVYACAGEESPMRGSGMGTTGMLAAL